MTWKISLNCGYGRLSRTLDLEAAGLFHYRLAYLDTQAPTNSLFPVKRFHMLLLLNLQRSSA